MGQLLGVAWHVWAVKKTHNKGQLPVTTNFSWGYTSLRVFDCTVHARISFLMEESWPMLKSRWVEQARQAHGVKPALRSSLGWRVAPGFFFLRHVELLVTIMPGTGSVADHFLLGCSLLSRVGGAGVMHWGSSPPVACQRPVRLAWGSMPCPLLFPVEPENGLAVNREFRRATILPSSERVTYMVMMKQSQCQYLVSPRNPLVCAPDDWCVDVLGCDLWSLFFWAGGLFNGMRIGDARVKGDARPRNIQILKNVRKASVAGKKWPRIDLNVGMNENKEWPH